MYGRPDLYGSTYVAQGLTQHRFKRLTGDIVDELFGPDDLDPVEFEAYGEDEDDDFGFDEDDEFAFDDVFGDVSMPAVPGFIRSRLPSWAKGETMVPGTPPPLPVVPMVPRGPIAHPVATQISQALTRYVGKGTPQVQGMKVHMLLEGPTWPHALQEASKIAKANDLILAIIVAGDELSMRGLVPVTLELKRWGR